MAARRRQRASDWLHEFRAHENRGRGSHVVAQVVIPPVQSYSMAPKSSKKAMMATEPTYGMSMDMPATGGKKSKSRRHRRGNSNHSEEDPSDGSASLTYSAGSSIASSAAGESTDSSFADIMRVLDVQDSTELAAFMKREGVTDPSQYTRKSNKASTVSVTSSLQYSTDGESALEGVNVLSTITG